MAITKGDHMKILVAGATGNVGRPLVEQLVQAGHQVRALTRNPGKANLPAGAEVIAGDLTNPETLTAAMEGVDSLHLINFEGNGYAPLETGPEIMALAEKAGVKRVTVLRGGERTSVEEAAEASSLAWTFLEPVEFMSGALDYAESIRTEGIVRQPFADRRTAAVHDADIASVAAGVLTSDGHGGKSYTLTGPEVLSPRKMVNAIGAAMGCDIPFIELTVEEANVAWQAAGMPQEFIDFMMWAYGNTPEVGYTVVPTVEQVTGHPPRTFAQWAAENVAKFRA
jgi:uncharacterized protein YbjT (DUF2867 family)